MSASKKENNQNKLPLVQIHRSEIKIVNDTINPFSAVDHDI